MKKIGLLFTLLLSLISWNATAQEVPTSGLLSQGDAATTLETGKWYFLYNAAQGTYAQENSSNALVQGTTPEGLSATEGLGYLISLEAQGTEGKYYLKTGLGHYIKAMSTTSVTTAASLTTSGAMTIAAISGNAGHYTLLGVTKKYMNASTTGTALLAGTDNTAGSTGDWVFYNATTKGEGELTGRETYNYQMNKMGLIRLLSRRRSLYLTTKTNGEAVGESKASSGLSQVWILEKSGEGYTLRSANTGQYLQANFSEPANGKKVLYFQYSPNNTTETAYCNISSASDFSGQTCLNMSDYSSALHKWSYKNDEGSDWTIQLVEDITEDQVREHLNAQRGYASELKSGSYYRLLSTSYSVYATEADNDVKSIQLNEENFAQYWKVTKNGNGYTFQNVLTQDWIQPQTTTSRIFRAAAATATLYPRRTDDKWMYHWVIASSNNGSMGMHTDASRNVVLWSTNADASEWAFQEVELSEEDIEKARGAQQEYQEIVNNVAVYQSHLNNLFKDKACTELKDEIQALSDDELAANADYAALHKSMQEMVLKVKNNTWQQFTNKTTGYSAGYEKFFRIADYQIYSNCDEMCSRSNFEMSNAFGRLSGPTGIVANPGDIVYIYVNAAPKSECSLKLETVSTDGVAGNHATGNQTDLKVGLNVYSPSQQVLLYIFHQLNNTEKYLADYPDIKIHIEGGQLNGYWDATRGMTNADWALLQQDLLKAPYVNLKTKHLVFQMDRDLLLAAEPTEMEGLMRIWDHIPENEDRYMGVEDFEGRYNNIWNVYSGASSYMHSTTRGTWYTESTISTVMNYEQMRQPGSIWGPSHEIGHNHQNSINVVGTTESSNNLFSNINTFEQGIQTTRCYLPSDNFNALANDVTWVKRDIWNTTRMFFQLYLYFHAMHHDDQFYPNLFRALRKSPITKRSGWDSTTEFVDDGETKTGANTTYGRLDYLHLAKTICDVAQADLSEFFESYGMFVPANKVFVGDYANYLVTTTQADIDAAKAYMQKYPKKLGNIMFIDDHILPMKDALTDTPFEGKPASGGKRQNNLMQHDTSLPTGDVGDYEDFNDNTDYTSEGGYYIQSGNKIYFRGSGYVGHKFYDKEGNLIWASNAKNATLPTKLVNLGRDNFTVVTAQANMTDVPCPFSSDRKEATVYFGNEESAKMWYVDANTNVANYLPENAMAVLKDAEVSETVQGSANVINANGVAKSIVLNGDLPAYIPVEIAAESVKFTKSLTGYAALNLPFDVTNANIANLKTATYENQLLNVTDAASVAAGKPVVVNGNVDITLTNATVKAGSYQVLEAVNVLDANGTSVTAVAEASPFTFNLGHADGIKAIENSQLTTGNDNIYDLSGRRIQRLTKSGLYISNGKKVVVK